MRIFLIFLPLSELLSAQIDIFPAFRYNEGVKVRKFSDFAKETLEI